MPRLEKVMTLFYVLTKSQKEAAPILTQPHKRLNPEVCPKTGTLGGFRCKVSNFFVNLQIEIS